ncbi:hypothetical protein K438DRAFT_1824129 [Mycena galopus ATCC 62051]|nr:hypothetical protein K438DRAFT_1824129 [Mycena galopus ATCC 62051]
MEGSTTTEPKIKITPWRLLNTVLVLGLGIYKASPSYLGQEVAPTTLDWIIGVLGAVIAYWVSFLEEAELGRGRWFFARDLSQSLAQVLWQCLSVCIALLSLTCAAGLFSWALSGFLPWQITGEFAF